MDPDIVRQQEEAERAAAGLAPKKPATNGSAGPIQTRQAASSEEPVILAYDMPETAVPMVDEKPAASAKQAFNPNRRALPPMGTGRSPEEDAPPRKRIRGLLRLFLYAAGGAVVGAILGFVGVTYFDLFKDQTEFFISSMAGGFALLFGLMHLLHYDT